MTSIRAPKGLGATPDGSWTGKRSFVFFPGNSSSTQDYLTQQVLLPATRDSDEGYPSPNGELMFGGALMHNLFTELANTDDSAWDPEIEDYLGHALDRYFVVEKATRTGGDEDRFQMKAIWSGIVAVSADSRPWVGRIPESITDRIAPGRLVDSASEVERPKDTASVCTRGALTRLAAPGEWISAGYSGEGMVHAWLSGKALAYMVLGVDDRTGKKEENGIPIDDWFPEVFRVSEQRWKDTGLEDLIARRFL